MDGFALSCRGLEVFGFDVDRLPDFVEASRLQAAIARNLRNDLQFLPVRKSGILVSRRGNLPLA
jgi:hypothetical protein